MNGHCIYCGNAYGNHKEDYPVKFRDRANPDPEIQEYHERLDEVYEQALRERAEQLKQGLT